MKTTPIYILMTLMTVMPIAANATQSCLLGPQNTICKTENLNLYVGPQSVEPGEVIFIAVETLTAELGSSSATTVIIIDETTGQRHEAKVEKGLAYLELTAPQQAGRLTFKAQIDESFSEPAEVLVHPGRAEAFDLLIEKNRGQVFIYSSIIADKFGNFIDDGIRADIQITSDEKVYSAFQTLTKNGRIGLHIPCDDIYKANSRIRAQIGLARHEIEIPPYICTGKE